MSGTVCSWFPGVNARAPRLYDCLPLEYPEYARRVAACVVKSQAQTTVRGAPSSRQRRHNDSCRQGSRLDIYDWECYAD
jgi:hypothetical protein